MDKTGPITWRWFQFPELSVQLLYDIIALREQVFVVEQNCPYLDADGYDRPALHLTGHDASGSLIAYLRLIPPGYKFDDPALGRVVVAPVMRFSGVGVALMLEGLQKAARLYPGRVVRISAQQRLQKFYEKLGFILDSDVYDEDGIPHFEMVHPMQEQK
ncbi:MAG: GNAT family N-acetyltransferase [bacterium]|nr:GNAT family N-acetyltransferase [bacterium]